MTFAMPRQGVLAVTAVAGAAAVAGAGAFALTQAPQVAPVAVAQRFLALVDAGDVAAAHALTLKNANVGGTPEALAAVAARNTCRQHTFDHTFPPQTHGNRLRRWLAGRPVDMAEVHVEFTGGCLQRITVRRDAGGTWRVFAIERHAG